MIDSHVRNLLSAGCFLLMALHATAQATEKISANPANENAMGIRADIGYTHDDNVNRSSDVKLSDNIVNLNVSKGGVIQVSEHARASWSAMLGGEKFASYSGLGRLSGGAQGEFMYRSSGDFGSPTWSVFARAFVDQYQSALRDSSRFSGGLSVRKPVTDRINLFGAVAKNIRHGKSIVLDTQDTALRMNVDYALTANGTIYMGGEYRRGDIVFSGQPSLYAMATASAYAKDDVFTAPQLYDYRVKGHTKLLSLGYNVAIGPQRSLDFSWRKIQSTPNSQQVYSAGSWVSYSTSYTTSQFFITYLTAF